MQDIEISFLCECLDISHAAIQGGERFVETVTGMTKQLFRIFKFITHTRICAPFPF